MVNIMRWLALITSPTTRASTRDVVTVCMSLNSNKLFAELKLLQDMVGEGEEQEEVAEALANLSDYCSLLHQLFI